MHACAKETVVSSFSFGENILLMKNVASELIAALRERLAIIADDTSRKDIDKHMARLRAVTEKITKLEADLPRPLDSRLSHYLQRQSYDKALELLETQTESHSN